MGRLPCCDKSNVKRGLWTAEEDAKILAYVSDNGPGNWTSVPKKAGLRRCGKSCRLRYTNYLRPDLKHDNFTPQEEELIINLHAAIGSRWSLIAQQLPGRTDNDVKNHWNTKLRKKLCGMGIDPVTHRPISQILADYENIGGLPKPGTRIGSLNRDLKNAFTVKPEPHDGISGIANHSMMPIRMPAGEPIFNRPFNMNNSNTINNHSLLLLAQFQAIKLVTEASSCTNQETIQSHLFSEGSSSTSSSSSNVQVNSQAPGSNCQPSVPNTPSSPFSWSEFLLDDAFLQPNQQLQQDIPSTGSVSQAQQSGYNNGDHMNNEGATDIGYSTYDYTGHDNYATTGAVETNHTFGASSTSNHSFLETMLDRDSEMSWELVPSLLEEPF
ncbi:hypothetical protein IFM89_034146 [Coptis chinensis]|uniref:MYB transcription factor n=1 Tax=Coptis chinensis TaxID=261450 RepID=A0A835HWF0_9MAGN|nr:hypothetical protein IFM89_034146 [Coptis chinensis]